MFNNSFEKLNFIALKMCHLERLRFEDIFEMRWLLLVLLLLFSYEFNSYRDRYNERVVRLCHCWLIVVDSGAESIIHAEFFFIIVCMQLPL